MIVTFKSQATADVIMFGDVAKRMISLMGKEFTDKGIITVEQIPDAITRLREAIADDKRQRAGLTEEDMPLQESDEGGGKRPFVNLVQRAVPLVEMLEWSLKEGKPVVWGV